MISFNAIDLERLKWLHKGILQEAKERNSRIRTSMIEGRNQYFHYYDFTSSPHGRKDV